MIAPKVSRRFYNVLSMIGLWPLFVGAFKLYARIVPPSKIITLDSIDGGPRQPYLIRWHIIPRNRWFNLYLHYFVHGDVGSALHDHPWASASLVLDGRYIEHTSEWMYDKPIDGSEASVAAYNAELWMLYAPNDGRTLVEGSVLRNAGQFPGLHKFDYTQHFHTGDFRRLSAIHTHRIELFGNNDEPCWTLFMTGRVVRRWGFVVGGEEGWRWLRRAHRAASDPPERHRGVRGMSRREKIVYGVLLLVIIVGLYVTQPPECRATRTEVPAYCAD